MKKAVIGIVDSVAQAEAIVAELRRTGSISLTDISVLLPDPLSLPQAAQSAR